MKAEHSINKQQEAKSSFLVKKSHIFKVVGIYGMFRSCGCYLVVSWVSGSLCSESDLYIIDQFLVKKCKK